MAGGKAHHLLGLVEVQATYLLVDVIQPGAVAHAAAVGGQRDGMALDAVDALALAALVQAADAQRALGRALLLGFVEDDVVALDDELPVCPAREQDVLYIAGSVRSGWGGARKVMSASLRIPTKYTRWRRCGKP